jgi:lipoprotein-anchoring transpeptidase ErfK/SrfK
MKPVFLLTILTAIAVPAPLAAQDRYAEPPPVVVSPDLSAPWVMQLQRAPVGEARRVQGLRMRPAPELGMPLRARARALDPAPIRTAAVPAPGNPAGKRQIDPAFLPATVAYRGPHKPGTIVINTAERYLYLVKANGQARRYGVGVGKEGFSWKGTETITLKREWPDWRPPAQMIERERKKGRILPVHMKGGPQNPLGARALYLGSTLYRIHGTNQPWTIGGAVSSGCIRMRNEDVTELYERVGIGTKVVVM